MTSEARLRVGAHGAFLATRHTGRQIFDEAVALLDDTDVRLVLDFDGVKAVTVAFADELVVNLASRYRERIAVAHTTREIEDTITMAFARRAST